MKKILLLLLFSILPFSLSIASFLDNSDAYEKVSSNISSEGYVNKNSWKVIRYDPPYYIIQGDIISNSFDNNPIVCGTYNFYYDLDKQIMQVKAITIKAYDANGNLISNSGNTPFPLENVDSNSVGWIIGNYYFYRAYNVFFDRLLNYEYNIHTDW